MRKEEYVALFKTEEGKKELVHELKQLTSSVGWKILEYYLQDVCDRDEYVLHDVDTDLETMKEARFRLHQTKLLLSIPNTLIDGLTKKEDEKILDDIYLN